MADAPTPTPTPTPTPPRRRRWRRALLVIVGLALLVVLAVGALLLISQHRLDQAEKRVARSGERLVVEAYLRPRPAEAADAAVLLLPLLDDVGELGTEAEMLIGSGELDEELADLAYLPELEVWIEAHTHVVARLHDALRRPDTSYDADLSHGWMVPVDRIPGIQALSRLLGATAWKRIDEGEHDAALACAADAVRLGARVRQWPGILHALVGIGVQDAGMRCAANVLRSGPVAAAALDDLTAALDDAALAPRAPQLLRFERALTHLGYENLRSGKPVPGEVEAQGFLRGTPLADVMSGWYLRFDQARYLNRMTDAIELSERPYRDVRGAWDAFAVSLEDRPWYAQLSQSNLVFLPIVAMRLATSDAQRSMARLAVEVERHALEHGGLPATLEGAGIEPPDDPLGDQPLRYVLLEDGGYSIRSVGADGVDDGGRTDDEVPANETSDLVWRVEVR